MLLVHLYFFFSSSQPVANESGVYGTELFTREAVKVINNHDPARPLFLYLAQQAVHSANPKEPLQAPSRLTKVLRPWKVTPQGDLRPVYPCDFSCDFAYYITCPSLPRMGF